MRRSGVEAGAKGRNLRFAAGDKASKRHADAFLAACAKIVAILRGDTIEDIKRDERENRGHQAVGETSNNNASGFVRAAPPNKDGRSG